MPGTFTDEKCAVALAKQQGAHRSRFWLKNLSPTTLTRLLIITALAAIASISLTDRVAMASLNWDYPSAFDCSRVYQTTCTQDALAGISPGDYIDRDWYDFLDKGQYYYLDIGQYKLLGGLSYRLGHPCYPKLFERPSGHVDYASGVVLDWLSLYRHRRIENMPSWLRNELKIFFSGFCGAGSVPMLIYDYDIWACYFNTGDYIDKWWYYYLDLGRYKLLDRGQYKWLGGLAYLFETPSGLYFDSGRLQRNFAHHGPLGECAIPEPATIAILVLGALGVSILGKASGIGKARK